MIIKNYKVLFISFKYEFKCIYNSTIYDISNLIRQKSPISIDAFRYLLENQPSQLYDNYQDITPNLDKVIYSEAIPFHSNGLSKKKIDYRDFFSLDNIVIKHFSLFLNNGDKNEKNRSSIIITTEKEKPLDFPNKKDFVLIYLITVSKPSSHLIREINAMSNNETAFVLFYDNKANRTEFYNLLSKEVNNGQFKNVYLIDSPRFHVGWAQVTQAFTQLVMMQAALKYFKDSLYLSCHSDSDYPLYPTKYIVKYLKDHYPNNYIYSIPTRLEGWKKQRKNDFRIFFNDIFNSSEKVGIVIKKLFPNKIIPEAKWKSGWNWFTMTLKDSQKMIDILLSRFDIVETLEYCVYADEILFPTLAAEANIESTNKNHRYVNWRGCRSHPNFLEKKHFYSMTRLGCNFWARKFNDEEKSKEVLNMIDNYIREFSNNNITSINC